MTAHAHSHRSLIAALLLALYTLAPLLEWLGCAMLDESVHIVQHEAANERAVAQQQCQPEHTDHTPHAPVMETHAELAADSHNHCHHGHYHPTAALMVVAGLPHTLDMRARLLALPAAQPTSHYPDDLLRPPRIAA